MKIGEVEIKGPVVLGPMAGVTTLPYRQFMRPFGVALAFTEMVSDCGIVYGNKETFRYADTAPDDHPLGLQIFGSSAATSLKAIEILEQKYTYEILDLNMGCPVYKVTKTGAGSAWLKRPEEMYAYARLIVQNSHKPVTAKIRLGWDENSINVDETTKLLEQAGIQAITVHCRTTKQGYAGLADYAQIRDLGKRLSVPLIVSGDIFTPQKAKESLQITSGSMVMVARGGLGNPRLVSSIDQYFKDGTVLPNLTIQEEVTYARDFASRLVSYEGERVAMLQLRGLIPHFFSGFPGYKKIRMEISQYIQSWDDLQKIFDGIEERNSL
jgi:nifR3 family TIM-barrel protein